MITRAQVSRGSENAGLRRGAPAHIGTRGIKCRDCGTAYAGLGADLVLPDQQWKAIFPEEGGILCANCICQRAVKVGGSALLAWVDNLDYERARQQFGGCECPACEITPHDSDCAVHNAPALPVGPCDCGAELRK